MPSFDFSKLGYYRNLFLFTFVTSRLALILPLSEITADNSGSWSDSNPIVIQGLKKTGSGNWSRSRSEWDYNPIRLTWQKRALSVLCFSLIEPSGCSLDMNDPLKNCQSVTTMSVWCILGYMRHETQFRIKWLKVEGTCC